MRRRRRAPAADTASIRNFMRVTPEFCTGGQPRLEALRQPQGRRGPGGAEPAHARGASRGGGTGSGGKAGLKYFNVPVEYSKPAAAEADEFLRITDDPANRPMFIHCTAAIRVGAFWMIRRVLRDGFTPEAALEEARKVGLVPTPHLEQFARDYIDSHKGKAPAPGRTAR